MRKDRTVTGYHGCDAQVAERLMAGEPFAPSKNAYDWLGWGIYFWEDGPDRALRFAQEQQRRGKVNRPTIVGAVIRLGTCFNLLDTRATADLAAAHARFEESFIAAGLELPSNSGAAPDYKLRYGDCAFMNWYLDEAARAGVIYDTVRGAFSEGPPVYAGSGFRLETHIQITVRTASCIVEVFSPEVE